MLRIWSVIVLSDRASGYVYNLCCEKCPVKQNSQSFLRPCTRSPGFVNTSKFPPRQEPQRSRVWSVDSSRSRRRWANDSLIAEAGWHSLQYTEDSAWMRRASFNYTVKAQQTANPTFLTREVSRCFFIPVLWSEPPNRQSIGKGYPTSGCDDSHC